MRLQSVLLFFFLPLTAYAQDPSWHAKIDPKLWQLVQKPDTAVEFLIIMQEQADVSASKNIRKKEDKGKYVFETLSTLAQQTQTRVMEHLQNAGVPFQSFWVVNGFWATGSKSLIEQLAQFTEVGRIELNPVWHIERPLPGIRDEKADDRTLTPESWGLTKINADDVWALGYTGSGVVVGGQDTGYEWEHPALKSKYRGWDGTSADHNYNWHDAIHALIGGGANSCGLNLNHPCDDDGHGTHTMGTMVGGPNIDSIFGVAPDAEWIGCRNMEEGDGTPATYIECFQWFIAPTNLSDQNPDATKAPHVINNSWSCPATEGCNGSNYATMEGVINNVRAAGILVVVSAGNNGSGCSTVNAPPSIFASSFAVGATNSNDVIANFSSRGPVNVYTAIMKPDISAPGVSIPSCTGNSNNAGTYTYTSLSGTSMAGPHVAGVAALIMTARPDLKGNVDALENVMKNTAVPRFATAPFCGTDNGASRPNNVYGWGRVDALAAVNTALPVELLYFSAKKDGKVTILEWATAVEVNCQHFTVQRSSDGVSWQSVGEIACRANGAYTETVYRMTDNTPSGGLNYYRLKQSDFSGEVFYSPVKILSFTPSGYSLRIASSDGKAYFEVVGENAAEKTWLLEFFSSDGRLMYRRNVGFTGWLDLPELPSGVYLAVLYTADGQPVTSEKWGLTR